MSVGTGCASAGSWHEPRPPCLKPTWPAFCAKNGQPEVPSHPHIPKPFVGHLTSAHDACIGKVFGKDGSQACQSLFIACRMGQ